MLNRYNGRIIRVFKTLFFYWDNAYCFIKRLFWTSVAKMTCKSYGNNLRVNEKSFIGSNVTLGNNTNFNGMHFSLRGGGGIIIGDNFNSGRECLVINRYHNYDHGEYIPYDDTVIKKDIIIEDNVWIGHRVIILGGVRIGEGAVIQAGSVVVKDIPKFAVAGGNPAKVFKMRDIEHYLSLKEKGKFL